MRCGERTQRPGQSTVRFCSVSLLTEDLAPCWRVGLRGSPASDSSGEACFVSSAAHLDAKSDLKAVQATLPIVEAWEVERVADYIRSLPKFEVYTNIDGCYGHLGATLADAILQSNNDCSRNVHARVARIRKVYGRETTLQDLKRLLQQSGPGHAGVGVRDLTQDRISSAGLSSDARDCCLVGKPAARPKSSAEIRYSAAPITRQTFCPPNPNEFEIAWRTRASRATFATQSTGSAGSGIS
jgi:hypothetical protein